MIKKLMKSIRQYKLPSLLAPIFVTMEVVLEVLIPYYMADLIDFGINDGNLAYIVKIGVMLAVFAMLSLLFGALSGASSAKASAGFAANLRHDMFYKVQEYSFSNIDKFSTSGLVTRMTTDVTNLQMAYMMIIRIAVRCPIMLIFAFVMSFSVNATISTIFLAVLPILGIGLYIIIKKAMPVFEQVFDTYDELNNVVQEDVRGIRVVKSFVREDREKQKFGKVSDVIYKLFSKAEKLVAWNTPLMQFSVYACMIGASWLGAHLIVSGSMTTGELMSIITYIMQMLMSLMMLAMIFVMLTMSSASAKRIVEVLDEKSDIVNPENPVFEIKDSSIDFDDVNFGYSKNPEKLCLTDVDIHIKSGETIGIIGGTGSSKSTFAQLIPRLYDVTSGSVKLGGRDVREYDIKTLRDSVAMVLQKNELFSGTIKENLRWGNEDATDEEILRVCRLACADEFIETMPDKYDTYIEQGGTNVSGGQKQRLCIARALLKKPKVLILDDSTSAVDTHTDAMIRSAFAEEIPDTTKLIIAQRISSVMHADRIIVLDGGKVAAFGPHDELIETCDIYKEVYETQTKGGDFDE